MSLERSREMSLINVTYFVCNLRDVDLTFA